MGTILTSLCEADPTLRWRQDPEIKQTVLEGMGEIHISVTLARAEKLGVGILTETPKVPYRETVTTTGRSDLPPQEADRRRGAVRRSLAARRAEPRQRLRVQVEGGRRRDFQFVLSRRLRRASTRCWSRA